MTVDIALVRDALPGYDVGGELGRGAWGVVLTAQHRQLGRDVAIKMLPRAFAADPDVRARFVAEARVLAALDHPHVVPVFDFVERDGLCLIVMERLPGGTVLQRMTTAGVTARQACAFVLATCAGLDCAHRRDLLHRDIKPENLLFNADGLLKITDFGIAKVISGRTTMATRAGDVLGTPAYMAPEQALGEELGPQADVYATGVLLFELLSGRLPFPGEDAMEMLVRRVAEPAPALHDVAPSVPAALDEVVERALARDPAARYPTALDLAQAVVEAAVATWGASWLADTGIPVLGTDLVARPTVERARPDGRDTVARPASNPTVVRPAVPSDAPAGAVPPSTAPPETAAPEPVAMPEPVAAPEPGAVSAAPTQPEPAAPTAQEEVVRAAPHAVRARDLDAIDPNDLVPAGDVVAPRRRTPLVLLALVLLALALAFNAIGLGRPTSAGTAIDAQLAGASLAGTGRPVVAVDLGEPVTVSFAPAEEVARVRLEVVVLGVVAASASADVVDGPTGRAASLDLDSTRLAIGGPVDARLVATAPDGATRTRELEIEPDGATVVSIPSGVALALALLVFAYLESLIRSLRRGVRRGTARIGLIVLGIPTAALLSCVTWLTGAAPPTVPSLLLAAAASAGAGWAVGAAVTRRRPAGGPAGASAR